MIVNYLAERKVAIQMQSQGYDYVLVFPENDYRLPLYIKTLDQACELLRMDFSDLKPVSIIKTSDFINKL